MYMYLFLLNHRELFQPFSYDVIGDGTATRYFQVNDEGVVTVKENLQNAPGSEVYYNVRSR